MLAVGVSPQIKKKRKRAADSLTPQTNPVIKKTKILTTSSTPSDVTKSKKKRKKISDAEVPELVLFAHKLEPAIKLEVKNDPETKVEVVDNPSSLNTLVIKSEPVSPVKKKKKAKIKIKEEVIEPEIPQPAVAEPLIGTQKKKKKKKSTVVEPNTIEALPTVIEPKVKVEIFPPKKVKKKKKSEVPVIKAEPVEAPKIEESTLIPQPVEDPAVELQKGDLEKLKEVEVKDEKLSLFNSDIKQELLVEDHIDQQLVRSLTYNEDDPCIHHQTTEIHIALPPVYTGRIQEGVHMTLKQHSLKYMKELKGVLLKYSILSLQKPTGRYLSTRPEFHFNITCQTTAFKPKIDQSLTGTVVKMGPGYVNCLVYGYFTAVVYGRFQTVLEPGTLISFKLKHYQQTSSDDLVLKGVPEVAPSS